ncbi:MAG: GTPase family protein [Oscillatoria sp. PMC 1051.18]|nr:GTPase family protein [Oscillatoria sp. PMC 1050.18]MEC5031196.1 GTPase family protein [Oscillatoria sp. PMC 1051.18]
MVRLKPWQWVVLGLPIATIALFLLISAGMQIHEWGINWIWAVFIVVFAGWRWLLVKWTRPAIAEVESVMAQVNADLEAAEDRALAGDDATKEAELALQDAIQATKDDAPIWEDWQTFWQRCQDLVVAIAHIYHPEVKYPLLSIYIPQAYTLIRGTVDDLDRWMQQISPVLNQVTVGQAYQAYEVYRKLEPSARKLWKVWNWAQWIVNPVVAVTKVASQPANNQATQQLLANLSQMLREAALRNLSRQAIALYSGTTPTLTEDYSPTYSTQTLPKAKTKTLQEIIAQAEPVEQVKQKPVSILLAGRTGSGKSSLINTLFQADRAEVDVLPSTDRIKNYHWETPTGETLTLWDTPGYEQVDRGELRDLVLDYVTNADLLLLVTPALDPALQMDVDFLQDMKEEVADLPIITIVTQVDRLRPIREWEPPYNWQTGTRPKEKSIREATEYRTERLQEFSNLIIPVVTIDSKTNRDSWNINSLSLALIDNLDPVKQLRLARFLRDRESRTVAAAKIIDRYTFQMSTTQGLTALLKSPILRFLSTISTGSPALAYALAEQIPVEQLPVVIGKLQMAYDLFQLLSPDNANIRNFDLLSLWSLLLENSASPDKNAWAFGHALVEFWTQDLSIEKLESRFQYYLEQVES